MLLNRSKKAVLTIIVMKVQFRISESGIRTVTEIAPVAKTFIIIMYLLLISLVRLDLDWIPNRHAYLLDSSAVA